LEWPTVTSNCIFVTEPFDREQIFRSGMLTRVKYLPRILYRQIIIEPPPIFFQYFASSIFNIDTYPRNLGDNVLEFQVWKYKYRFTTVYRLFAKYLWIFTYCRFKYRGMWYGWKEPMPKLKINSYGLANSLLIIRFYINGLRGEGISWTLFRQRILNANVFRKIMHCFFFLLRYRIIRT